MIKSMTGYGRGKYLNEGRDYTVEIKTVNSKYNDVNIRMPRNISYLEEKVRKLLLENVKRGKIDIFISMDNYSNVGRNVRLDKELAKLYVNELNCLADDTGIGKDVSAISIIKLPDVLKIINEEDEEVIWNELSICINNAISKLIEMRQEEGQKLKNDILQRNSEILERIQKIEGFSITLVEEYITKLENRINDLLKDNVVEPSRLAQEIVIYSDKCSIQEELTRIKSHINQLINFLNENGSIGKKLDFLLQEMNREINTIGSKANCLNITNEVVNVKVEIENIREQIQNIE